MKQKIIEDFKTYLINSLDFIKANVDVDEIRFNYICYQTSSTKNYEAVIKEFITDLDVISEERRSGRRITVAKIKEPIEESGIKIDKIEIREPKPKTNIEIGIKKTIDWYIKNYKI